MSIIRILHVVLVLSLFVSCTSTHLPPSSAKIDEKMGETWVRPGIPPPHQSSYQTPNAALLTNDSLWSLIEGADPVDHRAFVVFKAEGTNRGFFRGRVLIAQEHIVKFREKLLRFVPSLRELPEYPSIRLPSGAEIPGIYVSLRDKKDVADIRKLPFVDYVEPAIILFDSLACGADTYEASTTDPRARDGVLSSPLVPAEPASFRMKSDIVPYSYAFHAVEQAWPRFVPSKPGRDQGIAVLDSGVSTTQEQFFSFYATDYRLPHLRLNTTIGKPIDDECFHGTKVASIAAAPRDGRSIVGIAYNAPLITVKVVQSPLVLNNGSVGAICDGLNNAIAPSDGRPAARVIAMAFGLSYFSPTVAGCISDAFIKSPETIFLAAAGSNVSTVTFPANFKPFVVAVSMVELSPGGSGFRLFGRPLTVSYGPEVDFVSASTAGGIPASGRAGNTSIDQIARFRWSSAATGMYAGIIAVAGQYASQRQWDRAQLLSALHQAASRSGISDFSGEPLESIVGSGIVDLYRAAGGARMVEIMGPYQVNPGENITFQARTDAVIPPGASPPSHFEYTWFINGVKVGTQNTISYTFPIAGTAEVKVLVKDTLDGSQLDGTRTINVVPNTVPAISRRLFWASYVADWATFLNGGQHNRIINAGLQMPSGCQIDAVLGLSMCNKDGNIVPCEGEIPESTIHRGGFGFTVSRIAARPNDLEVLVHQWHDGFNAVRTKVVYDISEPAGVDCLVPGVMTAEPR